MTRTQNPTNRLSSLGVYCLAVAALIYPATVGAQESQQTDKAVQRNAKGPAVSARRPGRWIQNALGGGPEITQTRDQMEERTRLQQVYIDIITTLFQGLNQLIPLLPQLFAGDNGPIGIGELVITEIANDGTNTVIELYNPSGLRIELDNWAFCQIDGCTAEREMAGLVMQPDDIRVVQLGGQVDPELTSIVLSIQISPTLDEIGLYDFTGAPDPGDPRDTVALVDYVNWGKQVQGLTLELEEVAIPAGAWVSGTTIPGSLENNSFQLRSENVRIGGTAADYIVVPFGQASLGSLTQPDLEPTETADDDTVASRAQP